MIGTVRSYRVPKVPVSGEHQKLKITLHVSQVVDPCGEDKNSFLFIGELKKFVDRWTPSGIHIADTSFVVAYNKKGSKCLLLCIVWNKNIDELKEENINKTFECEARFQSRKYIKRVKEDQIEELTAYEISINTLKLTV